MANPDTELSRRHSFSRYLLIWMVVLVLCVVGFLTINDYLMTKSNFERQAGVLQVQTENNIEKSIRFKDALWNTFDASLNEEMKSGLLLVLAEYERAGRDPSRMDLAAVKKSLGDEIDIYIIDESGVIVYTTYAPELGMDFSTIPSFYQYLTRVRSSEGFFPDRIVNELKGQGKFRKYAYMPTPDHAYILELGLTGETFDKVNERMEVNENIDSIVAVNPYVAGYRVFNSMGRRSDDNRLPEPEVRDILATAIATRSTVEVKDPENHITRRYLFVDLEDPTYGSDPSRIIEITYSGKQIQETLDQLLLFHLLTGTVAILIGAVIAFFLSRRFTRPIQEIVSDVEIIALGDLTHRVRPTDNRELSILESSINAMVDSLRTAFVQMKDDEIFKNEVIQQMPVGIFIKRVDDGRYIFWNRANEQLFAIPATTILGKTDREFFSPAVAAAIEQEDREIRNNPRKVFRKFEQSHSPNGGLLLSISAAILDSAGRPQFILGISEDVSQENINLKMDLLFSLTRHEILDNLSVIMNYLERAQLRKSHDEMETFFTKTIGSITSIKNQIASMRALQDVGLISPKWQSLQDAFADAVALLPESGARIQTDLGDIEIFADPLLPRVFFKLLDFSFRNGGRDLTTIRSSAHVSGDTLHLIYQDDSRGIPDDEKEKIFEPGHAEGLFIIREILGFTGISITEIGVFSRGVIFDLQVPKDKFRGAS